MKPAISFRRRRITVSTPSGTVTLAVPEPLEIRRDHGHDYIVDPAIPEVRLAPGVAWRLGLVHEAGTESV